MKDVLLDDSVVIENDPTFGSPMIRGSAPNGYMSLTSDGVGPLWGGTGITCKQEAGPGLSQVTLTVDDKAEVEVLPGVVLANKYGAGAAQALTIVDNTLTPDPEFGAVSFVGAGLIKNITAIAQSYWIEIIPTAAFTWDTSGNIAIAGSAVVNKMLRLWHDNGTDKWYPSYVD